MSQSCSRREMLITTGRLALAGAVAPGTAFSAEPRESASKGMVAGNPKAAEIGNTILREGGNAIDAIIAAALAAAVVSPNNCGIGGYGGHMVIAPAGKKVTCIDFNSTAPAAARPDMFPLEENGSVRGRVNEYGWLAAGVPGTVAGLQLALDRYGTRSFRTVASPAIQLAEDGIPVTEGLSRAIRAVSNQFRKDPASEKLFLKNGEPLQPGDLYRNPDLTTMLEDLARENSVEAFYRGEVARRIASEFQSHRGLVTAQDLAQYHAREVEPLEFSWRGYTVRTAPLTAGGLSVLQALGILKALRWDESSPSPARTHALVEALRVAWHDRLQFLGDPEHAKIPAERLLSDEYAKAIGTKIEAAVQNQKPLPLDARSKKQTGTIHLNSVDAAGNAVSLTFTHGNTFGACVTVAGLGLTLGHGMSRFTAPPGHPNSIAPGKRPLHNMCPTLVFHGGKPVLALGGTGGRMIPCAVFNMLTRFIALGVSVRDAVAAPRFNTQGDLDLTLEPLWPETEVEFLKSLGYAVKAGSSATLHALWIDSQSGACEAAAR